MRRFSIIAFAFFFAALLFAPPTAADSPLAGAKITAVEKIAPADVRRLPIADFNLSYGIDSDGNGLSDEISYALSLPPASADEVPVRKQHVLAGFEQTIVPKAGTLFLEPLGRAVFMWYANPADGKAYFLGNATINAKFLKLVGLDTAALKKITVTIGTQQLAYYLGPVKLGSMPVSTGRDGWPTPIGTFRILNKQRRAWSKPAGLWMPNWMAFSSGGKYGIHELPEWPNGRKEGADNLGRRVSSGCIRLGTADSRLLYAWATVGTRVVVKR